MAALGIVLGTGPSLSAAVPQIKELQRQGALLFGVNNTYLDFDLDCWIACDPTWHDEFSPVDLPDTDCWHWDISICKRYGYRFIEGRWLDGLSTDPNWISFNHCSGAQALNLAVHYGCETILLVGHDFHYQGPARHYFSGLSDEDGEYPGHLRKFSTFDGLMRTYEHIADQDGLPRIVNCTPGSRLRCFPMGDLRDYLDRQPGIEDQGQQDNQHDADQQQHAAAVEEVLDFGAA